MKITIPIPKKAKRNINRPRQITLLMYKKWVEKGLLINVNFISPLIFTAQIKEDGKISTVQKFIML